MMFLLKRINRLRNKFSTSFCPGNYEVFRPFIVSSSAENEQDADSYVGVIGLEVHAQINVESKLFSSSPTTYGSPTNTNVSYFDAALPGTLPVLNKCCVEAGIFTALALNCKVHEISRFDRKHYFYPDLPAGYQITQQYQPLASNGHIDFIVYDENKDPYKCQSKLKQLQLEQDSGKSLHVKGFKSLVDLNRAGIGLMELVFEPNLKNGTEAASLIRELVLILTRLGTCSCEMEKGALRVDANVSVHKPGDPLGIRTEVKNINSIRFIAKAIDFEIQRQTEILRNGGIVINETRIYDFKKKCTVFMRDKEVLQDYRFYPEPDLPKLDLTSEAFDLEEMQNRLPILPEADRHHLMKTYSLSLEVADKLVNYEGLSEFFSKVAAISKAEKMFIATFLLSSVQAELNARNTTLKKSNLSIQTIAEMIDMVAFKEMSKNTAFDILVMIMNGEEKKSCREIVNQYNWHLVADHTELEKYCLPIVKDYSKVCKRYKRTQRKIDMTKLLNALNKQLNNRASIKDAEEVFKNLIFKKSSESD